MADGNLFINIVNIPATIEEIKSDFSIQVAATKPPMVEQKYGDSEIQT